MTLPADAGHLGIEILNCARRWTRLRLQLKLLLDSKTATDAQKQRVRVAYNKESEELAMKVVQLERLILAGGQNIPATRRPKNPFPWNELFGLLARVGAEGLNGALNGIPPMPMQPPQGPVQDRGKKKDEPVIIDAEIIDD